MFVRSCCSGLFLTQLAALRLERKEGPASRGDQIWSTKSVQLPLPTVGMEPSPVPESIPQASAWADTCPGLGPQPPMAREAALGVEALGGGAGQLPTTGGIELTHHELCLLLFMTAHRSEAS